MDRVRNCISQIRSGNYSKRLCIGLIVLIGVILLIGITVTVIFLKRSDTPETAKPDTDESRITTPPRAHNISNVGKLGEVLSGEELSGEELSTDLLPGLSRHCLTCICEAMGCVAAINECSDGACGPYGITEEYFQRCSAHQEELKDVKYMDCATQNDCSEDCVKAYMKLYVSRCSAKPSCLHYALIHVGGPDCDISHEDDFWTERVSPCCEAETGHTSC